MTVVLNVLLAILAIAVIVIIVIQPSKGEGLGSIGGGGQMFFAKNKGFEKLMEKATIWLGSTFLFIAIVVGIVEKLSR